MKQYLYTVLLHIVLNVFMNLLYFLNPQFIIILYLIILY